MEGDFMAKDCHVMHYQLGPLKKYVPCSCHENPYKPPSYWVRTATGTTYYRGSYRIKELRIECMECGRVFFENIEDADIFEGDLSF
jgi:hypothetical protein